MSTILWMQMSADGYAAAADGSFDWPVVSEEAQAFFTQQLSTMGTFAYGKNVYGWMSSDWPNVEQIPGSSPLDIEYGRLWVPTPKLVFSTTLEEADYNTTVARGTPQPNSTPPRSATPATSPCSAVQPSPTPSSSTT